MGGTQTGSILINLVDGTRQPLPDAVKWSATIHDGRAPSEWRITNVEASGSAALVKGLPYFGNFFDHYTVIVNSKHYEDAGWMPIPISSVTPVTVDLMLIPKDGRLNFSHATWDALRGSRPRFAEILSTGIADAPARYSNLIEEREGLALGSVLNLLTAMSQIILPSKKTPLGYYWQPIWDDPLFPMGQDRFFAYVDKNLIDDIVQAARMGAFSEEKNPGTWHPGATLSYKQTQFDVANLQLTFHQNNVRTVPAPGGPVDCIVVEPDIDYYKDLLSHFFLEVLPNEFTGGKTDPRAVYLLRWMAGKRDGSDFDPLYTIQT